jgi:hypothetical protein
MAGKKNVEVVGLPVKPTIDLEDILAARLADDLIKDVDIGKLTKLAIAYAAKNLKAKFISFLMSDQSSNVPLSEIDAIEASSEEVAA